MGHPPRIRLVLVAMMSVALFVTGCTRGPVFVPAEQRKPIDRKIVDYPGGAVLTEVVRNLTGPVDVEEDPDGNLIIAESGEGGFQPRIFAFRPDGTFFTIYPFGRQPPNIAPFNLIKTGFRIYGPIGGITLHNGKVYATHRDEQGNGVVTAFGYDGSHSTVVANLPAQGDNGMSDIVMGPTGRLWFGVGSATNSGVVGLDNYHWVKRHPEFCDRSFVDLKLNGYHFKSKNPDAGLFGGPEIAVTAPFQPFNISTQTRIRRSEFPTGAIYSADPSGGGLRVEAHGLRAPRGLAFPEYPTLFITNQGMELRGTRPIKDDPDAMLKFAPDAWYGFPDFSADLQPVTEQRFQPKGDMLKLLIRSGYPEVSFLVDHNASAQGAGLINPRGLVQATFPSLSGAQRFDFAPDAGPLKEFYGNAIVPLSGDRGPFATSGQKLAEPVGYRVVRVDLASREVFDLIRNTRGGPASRLPEDEALVERPTAVKFGRDGSLYIVDFGRSDHKSGRVKVREQTGRLLKLTAIDPATTRPATGGATPATQPNP